MKKSEKVKLPDNYLERVPFRREDIKWNCDDNGIVTLEIENRGWANRIAQIFFKRPKISYIHLDKLGSFVWPLIDGSLDLTRLGVLVDKHFGKEAHPLYERLAQYFKILESYGFILWK